MKFNHFLKMIIDALGSAFLLLAALPLMVTIALAIKFTSKGPVFFTQKRLGKNGKAFKIFKFRTMVVDSENIGDGFCIKTENDFRITKIGKFLRSSSLDELPQLFNVIRGEMSLVGPRPPLVYHPYNYSSYNENQKKRFEMKPGITGLTQVTVRNSISWDKRIVIDLEYVENFSIWLDMIILYKTIKKIFIREHIYYQNTDESSGPL